MTWVRTTGRQSANILDIVDANQVVAHFNYVNRIADGLGVELEAQWPDDLRKPRRYRRR